MKPKQPSPNRRQFLRGAGFALPWLESFAPLARAASPGATASGNKMKRLACFYMPDGVPMPLAEDPAYKDWSWFPHGEGRNFTFSKCLDPLEPLRNELTVFSGLSNPAARDVHGHSNADQFLTCADTGGHGDYKNSISLDQVFAAQAGEHTRFSSLILSTDGGTGSARGATTMSFNRNGRHMPAEHKPKRIFDMLFQTRDKDAARQLAISTSALDTLLDNARSLQRTLSKHDKETLNEYLQSVRDTEIKVEKAKRWMSIPLPKVDVDHLTLDITPKDPREYLQTMFELIYLAFKTDSTRVATYQIGQENALGVSDYLARAVGFNLTHKLSHATKEPGGWENFGKYNRFISEEYGRFVNKLKSTPEAGGEGSMLDNTLLLFGSASSAFHLSRNYPLILAGGKNMGLKHGQYLKYEEEKIPLSNLYLTMLHMLGVETKSFGGSTGTLAGV